MVKKKMNWGTLLSVARLTSEKFEIIDTPDLNSVVHPHQKDADRVLFSSAFRRLQSKTQVYIFPHTDYVRNRLTHSLEVASIGRILATSIFRRLSESESSFKNEIPENIEKKDVIEVVATACLSHDIGNPPFGHIGEYAIRSWFTDERIQATRPNLKELMKSTEGKDFEFFDGNAQGFRILTKLQGWGEGKGGLRLTSASLGASAKYPNSSSKTKKPGKYGYYESEAKIFNAMAAELGMSKIEADIYQKHPLAYISEAADDIAYLTSDIDDAYKFGMIDFPTAYETLYEVASSISTFQKDQLHTISDKESQIKFLRSAASLAMVKACSDCFVEHEEAILKGTINGSLMEIAGNVKEHQTKIRKICEDNIYFHPRKVKSETGAYEVVRCILSIYSEAVEDMLTKGDGMSGRSRNILMAFDPSEALKVDNSPYSCYLRIVDYVSGMTDRYALEVFETLNGKRLTKSH